MKIGYIFPGQGTQVVGWEKTYMKNMKKQEMYINNR